MPGIARAAADCVQRKLWERLCDIAGRFCTQAYTVCACGPLRGCGGFCLVLHPLSVKVRECVESEYGLSPSHLVLAWGTIQEAWPSKCHLRMSARGWKWIVVSLTSCCFPSHCLQLSWVLAVRRARLCPRLVATSFSVPRAVACHFA